MAANHGRRYLPINRPSPTSATFAQHPPKKTSPHNRSEGLIWGGTNRQADVVEKIFSKVGLRNPPRSGWISPHRRRSEAVVTKFPPTSPPKSRSVHIRWFGIFIQRLPRSKRRIANGDSLRWEFERTGGTRNVELRLELGTKIKPKCTFPICESILI